MFKKKRRFKKLIILLSVILICVGIYVLLDNGLRPNLIANGEIQLKSTAIRVMNNAVYNTLKEEGTLGSLLTVEKDNEGNVTMITSDSTTMNRISVNAAMEAQRLLADTNTTTISVPFGNLIGVPVFTGMGPRISIKAEPGGAVTTSFYTSFEAAGINQTRYKTYIVMTAYMRMVVGLISTSVEVSTDVLVSDAIIVGKVPSTYANVADAEQFMNMMP